MIKLLGTFSRRSELPLTAKACTDLTSRLILGSCLVLASATLGAVTPNPIDISMTAERWQGNGANGTLEPAGDPEFEQREGFPYGLMHVKKGSVTLTGLSFRDGTIEFDVQPEDGIPGIRFRQRDARTAEELYLRPSPDCAASNDCIQYAPLTHGVFLWNLFPQYQAPAPVVENGWNHFKLVVSGRRMNVFVNHAASPTLVVGRLEGDVSEGGLQLRGPAVFANLRVIADAVEGLPPDATPDLTDQDARFLRDWSVSPTAVLPPGREPQLVSAPAGDADWHKIEPERNGLINVSRLYGSPTDQSAAALVWLKSILISDRLQTKQVSVGWASEIWIFVNGRPVFAEKNRYYPETARKTPDGRLSLDNGSFYLPLQKGRNELVVGLSNNLADGHNHYGWGMEVRLHDLEGVRASQ